MVRVPPPPVENGQPDKTIRQALDELTFNQLGELIANVDARRRWWQETYLDSRRNIDKECGYPTTSELTAQVYHDLYERGDIPARVVDIYPEECWQVTPTLFETEDEEETEFERAFAELGDKLNAGSKWKDENNNPIWQYLFRADKLCGVGRYGCILLGVDDGDDLSQPLDLIEPEKPLLENRTFTSQITNLAPVFRSGVGVEEPTGTGHLGMTGTGMATAFKPKMNLMFMRVLDEAMCSIAASETDEHSERFGKPTMYNVGLVIPSNVPNPTIKTKAVHWTRIVHIADNLQSDEVLGLPRMQRAYNRLYDLHKLYGGSAEMYWLGALPATFFGTDPQLGGQVSMDVNAMKDHLENMFTGLQRWAAIPGLVPNTMSPTVVDPSPQIERALEALCIFLGVPKRMFMGSERGELSSGQDMRVWYGRCKRRQEGFITPSIVVPFIDRLIALGILPEPSEYFVDWPDISVVTDEEEANVSNIRTTMLATYAQSNIASIITPQDYLVRVAKFDKDEAEEMLENAEKEMEANIERGLGAPQPTEFDEEGNPIEPEDPFAKKDEDEEDEEEPTGTGNDSKAKKKFPSPRFPVANVFCPTGEGGGIDPSCSPKMSSGVQKILIEPGTNYEREVAVRVNVGQSELTQLVSTRHSRGMVDEYGNLYVWSANKALHHEVAAAFKFDKERVKFWFDKDTIANTFEWTSRTVVANDGGSVKTASKLAELVFKHKDQVYSGMDLHNTDNALHKYSSTQFNIPEPLASEIRAIAHKIPTKDLAEDGVENYPHVTVKYGLHTQDALDVARIVENVWTVQLTLGLISLFEAEEYTVVKVDVSSESLVALNKLLKTTLPCADTYPDYKPHITLAYVKKGTGEQWRGNSSLYGKTVVVDTLQFSNQDGDKTNIQLGPGSSPFVSNEDGVWRTIRGSRVFIEGGVVTKGPKKLVGTVEGGSEIGPQKRGTGTEKMLPAFGEETVDKFGRKRQGPRPEAEGIASAGYKNAQQDIKLRSEAITKESKILDNPDLTKDARMSLVSSAGYNHKMVAQAHKLASTLTNDADQIKHHQMKAVFHEKKGVELSATYKKLAEE